jgi:RepB DNA-primase from phage plasmid
VSDIQAGFRMIDTFASVGANSFVVTKTEPEWPGHKKKIWGKSYSIDALREKLPGIVRTAAIRHPVTLPDGQKIMAGENVIIRPTGPDISFIQLDDLKTPEQIEHVRPAALVIHATSPGNCQAWIAVSGLPEGKEPFRQFNRRVRSAVGANDEAASRATRLAGTENFKAKYSPNYPVVTIVEAHPGRVMTPEQLESLGLVAAAETENAKSEVVSLSRRTGPSDYRPQKNKAWPNYAISLAGAPRNDSGDGPDRSMADFTWCMTAIDWGWPIEQTAQKLPEVSEKARERVQMGDEGYPLITAQNAAAAVERNVLKRGRG